MLMGRHVAAYSKDIISYHYLNHFSGVFMKLISLRDEVISPYVQGECLLTACLKSDGCLKLRVPLLWPNS